MGVTGIGGLFFRAADPALLTAWYRDHLGIGADGPVWQQQAGPTVFVPFPAKTDYFPAEKTSMLNLRVAELDAMIATLAAAGIAVTTDPAWNTPETGSFARIHDPEGNPIELWEPPAE